MFDLNKYQFNVLKNIDKENLEKIIKFLNEKGCDYIEELLDDYLDIFTFEYEDFIEKFYRLNKKYNYDLINTISYDMNILEEFYN